ncbi:MAG: CooT family nickel-binding protein [Chloroflexi bacterium]|nr:CooT family nickel-binding protein [Chloroflexota bacterium]
MCQATVFVGDQEVARDVTWLELTKGGVQLATLFDEPRFIAGHIRQIDFLRHRVILETDEERENGEL